MKPILICAALLCVATFPANAFLDRMGWDRVDSEHYFVEASGRDLRVYEWQSQLEPAKTCVAMFAETGGPVGMDCDISG